MSYYCSKCRVQREQGCFSHGCPGIPAWHNPSSPESEVAPTPEENFRNAIRQFGVVNACEWFGHTANSEFTRKTEELLAK